MSKFKKSKNISNNISKFGSTPILNTGLLSTQGLHLFGFAIENINNYRTKIVDLLVEQFEQASDIQNQLKSFADQVQEIEDVCTDLINERNLLFAGGVNLDGLGEIVGESRKGKNDLEYRNAIYFRIFLNRSSGQIEIIQDFVKFITGASYSRLDEIGNGKCFVYFDGNNIPVNFQKMVDSIAIAGVKIIPILSETGNVFGFDGEGGISEDSNVRGYSELNYTPDDSGKYAEFLN